jgi:hypothetical protein
VHPAPMGPDPVLVGSLPSAPDARIPALLVASCLLRGGGVQPQASPGGVSHDVNASNLVVNAPNLESIASDSWLIAPIHDANALSPRHGPIRGADECARGWRIGRP